jgi:flavodoxin
MNTESDTMKRRTFLRIATAGVASAAVGACGADASSDTRPAPRGRILLAYFSRPGENYWNGGRRNLKVGNTEVLARMIRERLGCDAYRIRPVERYPHSYEQTVQRNVREQEANARPAIVDPLRSIERYDTVLLASPIWNVRAPMIMSTFVERHDFSGKTVLPLTTHAMSGLGTTPEDYARTCRGARIGRGLAIRGEEVRSAEETVETWLRRARLLDR